MTSKKSKLSKPQSIQTNQKKSHSCDYARPYEINENEFTSSSSKASAILKFNIPEQKTYKKNILTKVTVHDENDSAKDIDFNDIKNIIKENKKIKKVVIERVKVNEVGKLQLLFSKKGNEDEPLLENINKRHKLALLQLEKELNGKIFSNNRIEETTNQVNEEDNEENYEQINDIVQEYCETQQDHYEAAVTDDNAHIETVKTREKPFNSSLSLKEEKEDVNNYKNVELQRDTLLRKNKKNEISRFYYRAENHTELFELGTSYLRDYENGINNFSFFANNLTMPKQKSIFGVASFLNYQSNINITIITESIEDSIYAELLPNLKLEKKYLEKEDLYLNIYICDGVEIIEYEELFQIYGQLQTMLFEEFLDELYLYSDVTLWDLPEMDHLIQYNELFLPIIDSLDNVSLIVKAGITRTNEIEEQQGFFTTYQTKIKGMIFETKTVKSKKKTKNKLVSKFDKKAELKKFRKERNRG